MVLVMIDTRLRDILGRGGRIFFLEVYHFSVYFRNLTLHRKHGIVGDIEGVLRIGRDILLYREGMVEFCFRWG